MAPAPRPDGARVTARMQVFPRAACRNGTDSGLAGVQISKWAAREENKTRRLEARVAALAGRLDEAAEEEARLEDLIGRLQDLTRLTPPAKLPPAGTAPPGPLPLPCRPARQGVTLACALGSQAGGRAGGDARLRRRVPRRRGPGQVYQARGAVRAGTRRRRRGPPHLSGRAQQARAGGQVPRSAGVRGGRRCTAAR